MDKPLRVLHLEDDPDYPGLVRDLFEQSGLRVELMVAANYPDFSAALKPGLFDVILADYTLRDCNAMQALEAARRETPDTPVVLLSGTISEQAAIDSLKSGATDYIFKHAPERLAPAVCRAVQEARERAQRRRAEEELARREKYFRALTENSLDVLTIVDRDGVFKYNSQSVKHILGYEPAELTQRNALDFVHPEDLQASGQALERAIAQPQTRVNHQYRFRRKDGSWCHMESVGQNRLNDPEIAGVVINSRDITDRKALEAQLRQAQKMEAIGQLAGGIAHDFNNILTVIHGHAALLIEAQDHPQDTGESARQIAQAAERAAGLTRQLLAFSSRQVLQPRLLDLNEVVHNMTRMLGRILGEDIALQLNCCPHLPQVLADAGMIEQVLLNLAVNARDAMPNGGLLTMRLSKSIVGPENVTLCPEAYPGEFVCVEVSDTGCGIAQENLRRIFEPFFTTKQVGKGTGLGLATAYGIARQHQGWIEVESLPAKGATFRVFLPARAGTVAHAQRAEADKPARGGAELILVVEDESAVRELACRALARSGYRILQADSGLKALEIWRGNREEIQLVLTDLIMPGGMNGRELVEQLQAEKPALKVILTSGYSADVAGKDLPLKHGLAYLQKPYAPRLLSSMVRNCLDS